MFFVEIKVGRIQIHLFLFNHLNITRSFISAQIVWQLWFIWVENVPHKVEKSHFPASILSFCCSIFVFYVFRWMVILFLWFEFVEGLNMIEEWTLSRLKADCFKLNMLLRLLRLFFPAHFLFMGLVLIRTFSGFCFWIRSFVYFASF